MPSRSGARVKHQGEKICIAKHCAPSKCHLALDSRDAHSVSQQKQDGDHYEKETKYEKCKFFLSPLQIKQNGCHVDMKKKEVTPLLA